jgi:phosphinothricin acetyltransferase
MTLLREATIDDVPAIVEIYNALIDTTTHEWTETPHTVEEVSWWLADQRSAGFPFLVAVDAGEGDGDGDGGVLGWATYGHFRGAGRWPGYRFTVEHSIHVRGDAWGRGVGRALIHGLIDHAVGAGKRVMVAGIDAANDGSIAFHERLGFSVVARMPGVGDKWGQRLDLVLMQRDLVPSDKS